jgi:hypothetical protein
MLVIGLVIAAIAAVIWWIVSLGESAEETARRIEETEKSTEAFRDAIGEAVDRYKELNNLAKQYHDDNLTDLQKYENKLEEINEVLNRNETANSIMEQLNAKEAELQAIFDNSNSKKERESLQKQIDDLQKDREGLEKEMRKSPVISEADAAAAREKARLAMLESRFGDLLKQALTPQQEYADAISELVELTEKGIVTEAEQQLIKENAVKKLIDSLGIEKLIEVPKTAQNTYNEYFKKLQIAIDEAVITLEQYNIGLENAAKLLADDLGISEWVGTKNTKTLQQAYNDIAIYAQKVAMSMKEEAAARDRARAAFEKQSEYYNLYQKAKDALTPMADRIKEVNKKIDKEAAVFGWSKDVTDKMKALAEAEMNQVKESKRENQILTKGSTAYTDYQNKNIQNDHLKSIRDNSKKQVEFAQKTVDAVKDGFAGLEKCFEVIG